ncbi:unnamed protein product [Paramecium sonneborni]|uniref:Uncharacterized protein n=1 Tax=Paramecium sonneborni TaxID=65129 RepID=A0A8S1RVP0_9CILI|nr:unnamed protein product [Paramecium sonneborni]
MQRESWVKIQEEQWIMKKISTELDEQQNQFASQLCSANPIKQSAEKVLNKSKKEFQRRTNNKIQFKPE